MRIKKSPIFYAPSPRPPFFRNPFCRGSLLARVDYIYKCSSKNCAGRSLAPAEARCCSRCSHAVSPRAAARISMPFRKTGVTPARSSPPPHRGGLLLAKGSRSPPPSANCEPADPKFAPKISKNPPKTRKITKKACKLLYDTIIRTTFGASDPSKCDVNRVVATGKREKFTVCGNKRMSRRVVTTLRLVSTSNALRHDGRGPLVL